MTGKHIKRDRALELPEIVSGMLVLFVMLWEVCFVPTARGRGADFFVNGTNVILAALVWTNSLVVVFHAVAEWGRRRSLSRMLWWQLLFGVAASGVYAWEMAGGIPPGYHWVGLLLCFMIGVFGMVNITALVRARRAIPQNRQSQEWSPATMFFVSMLALVLVSTLILLTPGATKEPVSFINALFMSASATSITGLTPVDVGSTFTTWGQAVILVDVQVGGVGVMTFSYFVLLMVGKNLVMRDRTTFSALLDQEGVNVVPMLINAVIFTTLIVEAMGAVGLWCLWHGDPAVPQENLAFTCLFHSVSAFCNAGITLFPENMATDGVAESYGVQAVMMAMSILGTLGFGVYLEALTRLKNRIKGVPNNKRWSTSTWFCVRATAIIMVVGTIIMGLLGLFEPSVHSREVGGTFWEALWNTIGRSAGFTITDITEYGPVYHLFICLQMFIGGNPAGTGGGVFVPVFALCVLEVWRVLRSQQDVVMHERRIARSVVERAMATMVLAGGWVMLMFMILLLLEPTIAKTGTGMMQLFFLEVSSYTTTGYSISNVDDLGAATKILLCLNMLFGRVGMFTFMLIFVSKHPVSPFRYPETRLPLS